MFYKVYKGISVECIFLILALKALRVAESFIFFDKIPQIVGAKNEIYS